MENVDVSEFRCLGSQTTTDGMSLKYTKKGKVQEQ